MHPQSANYRRSHHGTTTTSLVLLPDLTKPELLTKLILAVIIATITYVVTKSTFVIFNKYHLRTKSANVVMSFWEWIKLITKINK